jgi:precorrin-2/cobalt-factor-2 C20-methyltransferase
MIGKLYVIGVGPGDPELLTLKAVRILGEVGCIFVPKGKEEGDSIALSIVRGSVNLADKEIVEAYFPMQKTAGPEKAPELDSRWKGTVEALVRQLEAGLDTAFITIGDPAIYSTFFYLHEGLVRALPGLSIEIVPGVSSINASACRAGIPLGLGDGRIAVLPANYLDRLQATIEEFDTVVLMKVHRVFREVLAMLTDLGLLEKAVYVARAGMAAESVRTDLAGIAPRDLDYFSMIIVRSAGHRS